MTTSDGWGRVFLPGRVVAVGSACGLLLTGCSGGEPSSEPTATVTVTATETTTASSDATESTESTEPTEPTEPTETATPDGVSPPKDDGDTGGSTGVAPKPLRDECVEITTPRDGRYTVYDAGTAVVRHGGLLRVGEVAAARGWVARVTDRGGDDDVEVEFTPGGRGAELELEVEIDDGRVESQICVDDRDDERDD